MKEQLSYYENKLAYECDPADLFEFLNEGKDIVALDTRRTHAYGEEHIPGAISLPHREMDENTTQDLDRTKLYVCYCDGIGCNGSTKGSIKMTQLGFKVKELIGGLEWWKKDGFATEGTLASPGNRVSCAC